MRARPLLFTLLLSSRLASAQEDPADLSPNDWSAIRALRDAHRHAVQVVDGGHAATSSGQRWRTLFDGRGFTTTPFDGAWTWGLELERYGFEGEEKTVARAARVRAAGTRLAYEREDSLTEWYVNDARGLEHGYTVHERPAGEGALVFHLAVRGDLSPTVHADARGARFVDDDGNTVLTYAGLEVFDAAGSKLPARVECSAGELLLVVDERDAVYPLTVDPIAQQAYFKASNTGAGDEFGRAVAVSGDTVLVGAPFEDSPSVSAPSSDGAENAGAAYVFTRIGTTWILEAHLKALNATIGDRFGWSVAISGNIIVVGAPFEDSNATTVNGDGNNDLSPNSGAAYVFLKDIFWYEEAYLKADSGDSGRLGSSVAASGDTVVVGAQGRNRAYVFVRNAGWTAQGFLAPSVSDPGDLFGCSVALSGDTAVVGARGEDSPATGINGNAVNNTASSSGAAYAFVRSGSSWSQQAYIKASNTGANDQFGASVALSNDTAVVGARFEDGATDGVADAGAAYVFTRAATTWSQEALLRATNLDAGDRFGVSVAVLGDLAAVGAFEEDSGATGIDGDQGDGTAPGSGAAYFFERVGTTWIQEAYVKAGNTGSGDQFGYAIALSEDLLVVGARLEDGAATGTDGDPSSDGALDSGAAYVFHHFDGVVGKPFCFGVGCPCGNDSATTGCLNSAGTGALLTVSGSASVISDDLVLTATGCPPDNTGIFFAGDLAFHAVFLHDGLVCTGGLFRYPGGVVSPGGVFTQANPVANAPIGGILPGQTRFFQAWTRDVLCGPPPMPCPSPCGNASNLSNAYKVTFTP